MQRYGSVTVGTRGRDADLSRHALRGALGRVSTALDEVMEELLEADKGQCHG
jgi:hypothetical protein